MRRLAALAVMVLGLSVMGMSPAHALGQVKLVKGCGPVGVATVDSIVHPFDPVGTGHPHQFYGNQAPIAFGNATTYAEMIAAVVPCAKATGDTAGYWSPPLLDAVTSAPITVQQFTDYWRCANGKPNGCPGVHEIPADARIVSHDATWSCGQKSGARSTPSLTLPDCRGLSGKPGLTLTSHITFPSYWDGQLNDHTVTGNDSEHFAYPAPGGGAPPGFPIAVTQLRETVQYAFVGDPATVVLASDAEAGTSQGQSLHGDFWQTWQPAISGEGTALQAFVDRCVAPAKQAKNCG